MRGRRSARNENKMSAAFENIAHGAEGIASGAEPLALTGRRAWIISDGVAGHLAITRGIAEALGLDAEIKPIAPRRLWRHLAPNGPADPRVTPPAAC